MNKIQNRCIELLVAQGIDVNSEIDFNVNDKVHTLSFQYIIETYMQSAEESQLVFLTALEKSIHAKDMGVERFFEGMGQLLLMTHLSDKIDI